MERQASGCFSGRREHGRPPESRNHYFGDRRSKCAATELPADEERIKARLLSKYNMAEIEAKHRPAIEERDQALALIAARKGRHYIVDFSKLQRSDVIAVEADYSKQHVQLGVHVIFPQGAGIVKLGEVEISTANTPIEKFLRTVEWIDTESKAGEKGST